MFDAIHRVSFSDLSCSFQTIAETPSPVQCHTLKHVVVKGIVCCSYLGKEEFEGLRPRLGCMEVELEIVRNGRGEVTLRVGRMTTSFTADLMLGFHQLVLNPGATFVVVPDSFGVEQLRQGRNDLLVDLGELV